MVWLHIMKKTKQQRPRAYQVVFLQQKIHSGFDILHTAGTSFRNILTVYQRIERIRVVCEVLTTIFKKQVCIDLVCLAKV